MLTGKSVLHVNQDIGKFFSCDEVKGYYNNLMEKVIMEPELVDSKDLPQTQQPNDSVIVFPVAVFQYGLGCYDLYLKTDDQRYLRKFLQLADWTLNHQDEKGRWDNFSYCYPANPYGAMAQGEAASLLVRAYVETGDGKYLNAARHGLEFMLTPVENGGTSLYQDNDLLLMEYTHLPLVLNGWVFAWWGLYDYVKETNDKGLYHELMERSCESLVRYLHRFSNGYWSKYDLEHRIASPFYHRLHIAQMEAMYQLTKNETFREYANKWKSNQEHGWNRIRAFALKAYQKITEKG